MNAQRRKHLWKLLIWWGLIFFPSTGAIAEIAAFPDGMVNWSFGPAQELYVINSSRLDDSSGIVYEVSVWPEPGGARRRLSELFPGCELEDLSHIAVNGDTVYLTTKCYFVEEGQIWVSIAGSGFRPIASFEDPYGYQYWRLDENGHLLRYHSSFTHRYSWEVSRYSPAGMEAIAEYEFRPDTAFATRFNGVRATNLVVLANGEWLFVAPCSIPDGNLDVEGKSRDEVREMILGHKNWILFWTLNPEEQSMQSWGVRSLEEVCHGSVQGWLGKKDVEVVSADSSGVSYLVQGGKQFPRRPTIDAIGDTRLYLLKFNVHGIPSVPSAGMRSSQLRFVEQLGGGPVKRLIRKVPDGLRDGRNYGSYMLIEMDSTGGILTRFHEP